jgi:solute carrier family 35, member E3
MFVPRRAAVKEILPLSVAMCMNVILPNLSLAFSSVTFYQVARILLTPTVAIMNFVLYKATLPRNAILTLIPACLGVGIVSYYDSQPTDDEKVKTTSGLGIIFAFTGIFASSLYTVWIGSYHKKLQMNSMQLLFNQAPVSAFLLLYVIPFVDTFPVWNEVPISRWLLILMVCANPILQVIPVCTQARYKVPRLTYVIISERCFCLPHQSIAIFHRCANRSSF